VAFDAIAVIINQGNPRETFTHQQLQELLEGNNKEGLYGVFDGKKATSTIRYAFDSILRGKKAGGNILAAADSKGVIDFVSDNPNAVGFVGISWIGNPEDTLQRKYLQKVKIAAIQCDTCRDQPFVLPDQKSIYNSRYTLLRPLIYILKENYTGLGRGFANFMELERGQLIFRRAYLYPAHMPFEIREIIL
jgi:phosphate transport system substrate-binding protein